MGSKDKLSVGNGDMGKGAGQGVVFAKRSRGNKARKRIRPSLEEDRFEPIQVNPLLAGGSKKMKGKQWTQETFESVSNTAPRPDQATAERLDVGGNKKAPGTEKGKKPFGPLSAPSHLRTSMRVDYQPDVCKDYKETGYCGFGDSCKFLHDRSDYKAGWQLDKEWAEREKERKDKTMHSGGRDKEKRVEGKELDADGLPFACFVCRGDFVQPVVTLCAHYFCENCILQTMETSSACPVCKKPLRGTLNPAQKLMRKLVERKE